MKLVTIFIRNVNFYFTFPFLSECTPDAFNFNVIKFFRKTELDEGSSGLSTPTKPFSYILGIMSDVECV